MQQRTQGLGTAGQPIAAAARPLTTALDALAVEQQRVLDLLVDLEAALALVMTVENELKSPEEPLRHVATPLDLPPSTSAVIVTLMKRIDNARHAQEILHSILRRLEI